MPNIVRFLHILRRGQPKQRVQVILGLVLVGGALAWVVINLWQLFLVLGIFVLGLYLIARSLREPRSGSSSS
jgi:hypothetical protein